MSLAAHFKTNADLERKGVAVELPENTDGTIPTIGIARAGRNNPDYQKVVERIMRPFRRAQQVGALPPVKQDELTREIYAEAGILWWKNVLLSDVTGNADDVGFAEDTKDNKILLLKNLPDLYSTLIEMSVSRDTFLEVVREEEAKNSAKSLPTQLSKDRLSQE